MAQPKKLVKQHNIQCVLAEQEFAQYIDYIAESIITKYGKSYQRVADIKDNWRKTLEYSAECEDFLIAKSKHFLRLFPTTNHDYQSPVFFRNIIGLISDYLSVYFARKGVTNRNICTAEIRNKLYSDNPHVNLEMNRYIRQNERTWGLQQKRKRERIKARNHTKKTYTEPEIHVCESKFGTVQYSRDVNLRIAMLRAELGLTK
jgi:hypothetical protein